LLRDKRLAHIERLGASERQTRKLLKPASGSGTPLLTPRQLILEQRAHNAPIHSIALAVWFAFRHGSTFSLATSPLTEQRVLLNLRRCVERSSSCPALISIRCRDSGATSHAATTAGDLDLFLHAMCPGDSFKVGPSPEEPALGTWVDSEPTSLASTAPFCVRATGTGRDVSGQCWSPHRLKRGPDGKSRRFRQSQLRPRWRSFDASRPTPQTQKAPSKICLSRQDGFVLRCRSLLRRSRSHAEGAGSQALWPTGHHRLYSIEQVSGLIPLNCPGFAGGCFV
jgi:hypothetical protein